ncbi:unnamed protein product [Dibothriocephalus latus]|uniref:lipoyl(octanoyl) transferase n=1 Tax=Dibothriocephalus latus TaxID=60516 RepID=A0A3P7LSD2_DIBLA|nr:unnamed protein product [Dibothriocephalus latus]
MALLVRAWFLGSVNYLPVLELQKSLVQVNKRPHNLSPSHTILLVQHEPVYTVGIRHNMYDSQQTEHLKNSGAHFIKYVFTNRGGLITYHGPGQLTAYPIIHLRSRHLAGNGLRWYVGALEQAGHEVCRKNFSISTASKGSVLFPENTGATGVWLDRQHKIMSIGIHRSGEVTYHGVGLNCTNEPLRWFDQITPCGLVGCKMASIESATNSHVTPETVAPVLAKALYTNLFRQTDAPSPIRFTFSKLPRLKGSSGWETLRSFILHDADLRSRNASPIRMNLSEALLHMRTLYRSKVPSV